MLGITSASARTIVVFAVPFSPRTRTPPTSGDTVVKISASAMSWEPTTAENGNVLTSHPSCGSPRPRHVWVGSAYADATATSHGRRPDFPGLLLSDQLPESQWRDRSGLAPDSSAVAVPDDVTSGRLHGQPARVNVPTLRGIATLYMARMAGTA